MPQNKSTTKIGPRIVEARLNAGYATQKQFAQALGVSLGLVGQWEANVKMPGRSNLVRIAEICAVSIEALHGVSNEKDAPVILKVTDKDEQMLVLMYRQLVPLGKKNLVDLLKHGLVRRHMLEKEKEPV